MSTGERPLPSLLLCVGPERWLRAERLEGLRRRCLAAGFEETDQTRLFFPAEPEVVLGALRTAPFGSARRLVILEGMKEISAEAAPWLAEYLANPGPTACLVLCADQPEGRAPRRSDARTHEQIRTLKQLQALGPGVQIAWCLPMEGGELEAWLMERAGRVGKRMEPAAVKALAERVGSDLGALSGALEMLGLLVGDSDRITEEEVKALIPRSERESAFEVLELAGSGRPAQAILAFREALAAGELAVEPFLGALGWHLRRNGRLPRHRDELIQEALRVNVRMRGGHPDPEGLVERLILRLAG